MIIHLIQIFTWFVTIFMSMFTFFKILNISLEKRLVFKIILGIISSLILAFLFFILREFLPYLRFAILVVVIALLMGKATATKYDLALTASAISLAISQGLFVVFTLLSGLFILLITVIIPYESELSLSMIVAASFLTTTLTCSSLIYLFKIKRLRSGMLFLKKKGAGLIGILVSGMIFVGILIVNQGDVYELVISTIIIIALCLCSIFIWWRRGITKQYREHVKSNNALEYEKIIAEKDEQIKKQLEDIEVMSKLIHRDNKILPALFTAVERLSNENADDSSMQPVLNQIEQLMTDRAKIVDKSQHLLRCFPSTDNILIDAIIRYMMQIADGKGIQLDVNIIAKPTKLLDSVITPTKFETLLADLIENAINATLKSEKKQILITFEECNDFYEISVKDSGIPFEIETLLKLGEKHNTTRANEGGSGIGYLTIFEILHEHNASIIISENEPNQNIFSKSISIIFDNNAKYSIHTHRANLYKSLQEKLGISDASLEIQNNNSNQSVYLEHFKSN